MKRNSDNVPGGNAGREGLQPPHSVLLLDNDTDFCRTLSQFLSQIGFECQTACTEAEGIEIAVSGKHSIVTLDVALNGKRGFEVLRRIRSRSSIPVIMLTQPDNERERIRALEMGADDSLPNPFSPRELAARIAAVLRRARLDLTKTYDRCAGYLLVEDVELDRAARIARCSGATVRLTTAEFDLLEQFLSSAGRVIPREELVRRVLGREFSPDDRSIDTHVSNLRRKLGRRPDGLARIKNIRGIGYLYVLAS